MSAKSSVKDILLSDQSTWDGWYENIKGSVPDYLWKYFDPDNDAIFVDPVAPVEPVMEPPPEMPPPAPGPTTRNAPQGETPEQRASRESRYKEDMDMYFKRHTIYRDAKKEWEYYHAIQTKLRDKIQATVAKQKAAKLRANLSVRTWLKDLKALSAPPEATTKRSISVEYHRLMNIGLTEWPTGGPSTWLAKWEDLICRAEQFNVTLENWLTDVSSVWQRVPGVAGYFDEVERKVVQGKQHKYSPADISAAIQQYWERRREGTVLKFSKPKVTRSAFATGITFDGKEASDIADPAVIATSVTQKTQLFDTNTKNRNKRRKNNATNHHQSRPRNQSQRDRSCSPVPETRPHPRRANRTEKRDRKQGREPCSACGGTSHSFTRCYLVLGQDKDWIPEENQETFRSNMKVASFKQRVDDFRASQKSFED